MSRFTVSDVKFFFMLSMYKKVWLPTHRLASNPRRADRDIVIPESIRIATIALPAKVNASNLRLSRTSLPLPSIRVTDARLYRQTRNSSVVEPGLKRAIRAEMVLEARPCIGCKSSRRSDTLGRKVGKCSVVGLAVVHEDFGLATDTEVLVGTLCGVGHGDEGDVRVC